MKTVGKGCAVIVGVILIIALAVGVGFAGREFNWWLRKDNTDRQTKINDQSYSRQTALKDTVMNDAKEISRIDVALTQPGANTVALNGQRKAIVSDMCDAAGSLTGKVKLSVSAQTLITQECI